MTISILNELYIEGKKLTIKDRSIEFQVDFVQHQHPDITTQARRITKDLYIVFPSTEPRSRIIAGKKLKLVAKFAGVLRSKTTWTQA